jgi:Sec7-like guanine-nucleotide exchange factor
MKQAQIKYLMGRIDIISRQKAADYRSEVYSNYMKEVFDNIKNNKIKMKKKFEGKMRYTYMPNIDLKDFFEIEELNTKVKNSLDKVAIQIDKDAQILKDKIMLSDLDEVADLIQEFSERNYNV